MLKDKPMLGILLGDSSGVGPEIAAKLAISKFYDNYCLPIIIGDIRIFCQGLKIAGGKVPCYAIEDISQADWEKGIPVLDSKDQDPEKIEKHKATEYCGKAILNALTKSVELFKKRQIEGFAFAPFNKTSLKLAGCPFESEHHYLANLFACEGPFGEINVSNNMWTTRTTSHIPIKDVSKNLSVDKILNAVKLCNSTLCKAGFDNPRIGVAALNPHCGEGGLCGREEIDIIAPAIKAAQDLGMNASGPFSSDILFIKAFKGDFEGVVTMYHDQGQIALKLTGFDQGITIAGGLPAPIATCAHGTAYDIAGKGIAKTTAFENAIKMTARMALASRKI